MSAVFEPHARSGAPELMDDDATDYETFRDCLVDLARVNRLTLAYRPTIAFLERLRRAGRLPTTRPLTVLDVGSGFGDGLREIARWAERSRAVLALTGVDRNPWSARAAAEAPDDKGDISWLTEDVFAVKEKPDVVVSSLFTHHLDDGQLARFIAWSEGAARLGWFVNDLRRSRFSYLGFAAASAALGMHRFVRHDGPVSIARSFVEDDWRRALAAAGVPESAAEIDRVFPFRLCVTRIKPGGPAR